MKKNWMRKRNEIQYKTTVQINRKVSADCGGKERRKLYTFFFAHIEQITVNWIVKRNMLQSHWIAQKF